MSFHLSLALCSLRAENHRMQSLQFWKSWAKAYQRIGLILGGAFIMALLFLWYSWIISPAPALTWYTVQEQELTQVPLHTFQKGLAELTIYGDNYLIFERLLGDDLKPNVTASYIFLSLLVLSMVVMLTIVTTLKRFWYLLGMGLFILFIVGFRMEILEVFGMPNKTFTLITLIIYCIPSFYYQFFNTSISFRNRLLLFSGLTLIIGVLIIQFATVPSPLLHLSVTGIAAGICISIVFILMVAHEILASFIFIASQSEKQNKSLNHFLIISTVYMVNLALAYAHKIGSIDWDFLYINFYLLLTISGILGVWGFRQREPQYEKIISADPFGVYLFLCLAIISFSTIGYFIGTVNDAGLVTINDAIIYAHLGYGIIFLTYVLSNFIAMLAKNMPVYKVLYKPNNMPYFTFRFGGIIATLAFVFYNTWQTPVQHAFGAYFIAGGDLYQKIGDNRVAQAFYEQAGTYGFLNHHSNYATANLEAKRNYNSLKERNYYARAIQRRPTEFAYLNLSETYIRNKQWLEARLILNEARKDFPNSGSIDNTLGIVFSKMNLADSSLIFLQKASEDQHSRQSADGNFIGVAAKNNLSIKADSLFKLIASENPGTRSNALAFANLQGTKIDLQLDFGKDTTLNLFSASLINNYLLNHLRELDTALINHVTALGHKAVNRDYSESLLFASALAYYADGQIEKAFTLLEEVTIYSNTQDKYLTLLAMWALENNAPIDAVNFIDYVIDQYYTEALPVAAIAYAEAGRIEESLIKWDSLQTSSDSTYHAYAQKMITALSISPTRVAQLNEEEKFLYSIYRTPLDDSDQFQKLVSQLENDELKARAILTRSQTLFEADQIDHALLTFQLIEGLQLIDKNLFDEIKYFELALMAKKKDLEGLAHRLDNNKLEFIGQRKNEQIYYQALINESKGDSMAATKKYKWLATANPYDEESIVAAANYFKSHSKDDLKSYSILVEALHSNPFSVKLLKAYSMEAARLGFVDYANDALERLRPLLSIDAMRTFLLNNQNTFALVIK